MFDTKLLFNAKTKSIYFFCIVITIALLERYVVESSDTYCQMYQMHEQFFGIVIYSKLCDESRTIWWIEFRDKIYCAIA